MLCGVAAVLLKFSLCLQRLQNRAVRIFTNSAYDAPIKFVWKIGKMGGGGWKAIQQLIFTQTMVMILKSLKNLTPQ